MAEADDNRDALNDKTCEEGVHVNGVKMHDEVAGPEDRAKHPLDSSSPTNALDDEDSIIFRDVIQRSISNLGLDDDEDYLAMMAYSKATASRGTSQWGRPRSSPPPPVILHQRIDGSPMTETIWTPKPVHPSSRDDQLQSLLWKLQHPQQPQQTRAQPLPELQPPERSSSPPNVPIPEDRERDKLCSISSHSVPIGSPWRESPSGSGGTHAERLEGGDFVGRSSPASHLSGATPNQGATPRARSGSVDHLPHVLPGPHFSDQSKTPQVRFSPSWSAHPPGMHAGPVPPTPMGVPLQNGRMPGPSLEGMSLGIHPIGFGNRMSLPPVSQLMLGHGQGMMPHCSPMLLNNPEISGRMPVPSNLPGVLPGMNQVSFGPHNTGSSLRNQQPAYQMGFGNPPTFGMPPTVFGNRMPLPSMPDPVLGHGGVMIPPSSPTLLNNPAIRGRMPLTINLPDFQPGMNQVSLDSQNTSSINSYQQHAFQTGFGNLGGTAFGNPSTGFGNRVPLPPMPNPVLSPGWAMIPPYSATLSNDPAMRGRMPSPSNLQGFQPEMNQVQLQNGGSSYNYQQHAYQTLFGNYHGATMGGPLQTDGGVQQQMWHPYPRTQFPGGTLNHRDGRSGSFHQGGNVGATSNGPTIVRPRS